MKPPDVLRQSAMRLRAEIQSVTDPIVVRLATSIAQAYDDMADRQERDHRWIAPARVPWMLDS